MVLWNIKSRWENYRNESDSKEKNGEWPSNVPIELRTLDIIPKVLNNQYEVYTDGSRIGDDTGFSVCILKNGEPFKIFQFKLNKNNTVFQAELAAIDFVVCWALENGVRFNIHTDNQSSIKVLRRARSRSAT
ncbi:hypothetical protein AVEN_72704-1, partial [Araneus ventricosus]